MSKSQALAQLFEVLRGAVVAMNDRTTPYERGAVAARWIEFEIAPLMESIDLENEIARVEMSAIVAHLDKRGRMMLPIDSSIPILPGQSAQITARSQAAAFLPERILISPVIAPYFHIEDLRVGNRSQFLTYGGCDASLFSSDKAPGDLGIQFETVQTAMDLVFVVTYTGGDEAGVPFRALVLGVTPDSRPMRQPVPPPRAPRNGPMPKADAETLLAAWREIVNAPTQSVGQAVSAANAGDELDVEIDFGNNGNFG